MKKRIIVVGATSGIGREVAKLFAGEGWSVGAVGRRGELLESLQKDAQAAVDAGLTTDTDLLLVKIKKNELPAERCEDYGCDYCTTTKIITEPIDTDLFGMSNAQIRTMNGNV